MFFSITNPTVVTRYRTNVEISYFAITLCKDNKVSLLEYITQITLAFLKFKMVRKANLISQIMRVNHADNREEA